MKKDILLRVIKSTDSRTRRASVRKIFLVFGFVGVMGLLGAILSFGILVQAGHQLLGQAFDQSAPSFVAHATVQLKTILEAWIPAECRLELDEIYNRSLWRSEPVGDILGSLVNVCVKGSITQTSPGELI